MWYASLRDSMNRFNINAKLIKVIQGLYEKAIHAIYSEGKVGEWFSTKLGIRQGCLISSVFNIILEQIMNEALLDHEGNISTGGRAITNIRLDDGIYRLLSRV